MPEEILSRILDDGAVLASVVYYLPPEMPRDPVAVELRFGGGQRLCVSVRSNDDTLAISGGHSADDDLTASEMTSEKPWNVVIGQSLLWVWHMRNHLGYNDGIQVQFTARGDQAGAMIQFMAEASVLSVRSVKPQLVGQE